MIRTHLSDSFTVFSNGTLFIWMSVKFGAHFCTELKRPSGKMCHFQTHSTLCQIYRDYLLTIDYEHYSSTQLHQV
jgi:hypothetical protein